MPTIPPDFRLARVVARTALVVSVLAGGGAFVYGLIAWVAQWHSWAPGLLAGGLVGLALGALLYTQFSLAHKTVSNTYRAYDALLDIAEILRRQSEHTRTISENSSLSDWAKRIVYREKDYEYLRDTIHSAIVRDDWVSAQRLIKELDEEFGLHEEAARLREEMARARESTTEEKVVAALQRFDLLCEARKWDQARDESERLKALFPEEPRIAGLSSELDLRRRQHKRRLLKQYDQAVRLQSVDRAHRLLFELDHYLAPNEAAAMKESARGVFRAKLQQMGVQFSLAVTDKHFEQAIDIGQRLVREFPNSRFAHEISSMMPALRRRVDSEASSGGS